MIVLFVYGGAAILFLALCVITYMYAVSTRRQVVCSSCGETVKMEHDRVQHCPSCGAPLT